MSATKNIEQVKRLDTVICAADGKRSAHVVRDIVAEDGWVTLILHGTTAVSGGHKDTWSQESGTTIETLEA